MSELQIRFDEDESLFIFFEGKWTAWRTTWSLPDEGQNRRFCDYRRAAAARIVACVTACAGIPTETVEQGDGWINDLLRLDHSDYQVQQTEVVTLRDQVQRLREAVREYRQTLWADWPAPTGDPAALLPIEMEFPAGEVSELDALLAETTPEEAKA